MKGEPTDYRLLCHAFTTREKLAVSLQGLRQSDRVALFEHYLEISKQKRKVEIIDPSEAPVKEVIIGEGKFPPIEDLEKTVANGARREQLDGIGQADDCLGHYVKVRSRSQFLECKIHHHASNQETGSTIPMKLLHANEEIFQFQAADNSFSHNGPQKAFMLKLPDLD